MPDRTILSYRSGGEKFTFEIFGGAKEFREWIRERMPESAEQVAAIGLAHWLAKNKGSVDFDELAGVSFTVDIESGTLQVEKQ